jgi:spermidine/putrescine transport system ATP-binding protein
MTTDGGGRVELVDLVKRFGEVTAVDGISIDIPPGQFFSLLGPSGCGKTTTLRLIGGFERPDEGRIVLDGRDMANTPPHKRPVNTVFQNYALFPHLNVRDNVAFGLRFTGAPRENVRKQVGVVLELVRLSGFEERRPTQLSGGQQQRVALARALILNPRVLLLDEPLGSLDAKLRKALQLELKAIQEEIGITFIYVTHDQEEAMTMSDHLAVMSDGRVVQVGPPRDVYEEPADGYVADFLGVSNLMDARGLGAGRVALGDTELEARRGDVDARGEVKLVIRPERVRITDRSGGTNRVPCMVERSVFVGPTLQIIVRLPGGQVLQATEPNRTDTAIRSQGDAVEVHLPPEDLRVLRTAPAAEKDQTADRPAVASPS